MSFSLGDLCLLVLSIFISPVAVLLHDGCGVQFLINIILYFLGIVPGAIHAIWLIFFADR